MRNNWNELRRRIGRPLVYVGISAVAGFGMMSCGDDDDDETTTMGRTAAMASNVSTARQGMVPDSLDSEAAAAANLLEDPCAAASDFFDCQPQLLKLYLDLSRDFVGALEEVLGDASGFIDLKGDGTSGTEAIDDDGTFDSVSYDITDSNNFSALLFAGEEPGMFISASQEAAGDPIVYRLQFDGNQDPEGDGGQSKIQVDLTYTSATEYDVTVTIENPDCDPDDVQAPTNFVIEVSRAGTEWNGRANLYMPRWISSGSDNSCATTPTSSTEMYMYHEFVGNDTNSTASLYLGDSSFTNANKGDYDVEDFCAKFSSTCTNGTSFGSTNVIADSYLNPFCATSSTATWNSACSGYATSAYSSTALQTPDALKNLSVSLPTSLTDDE